MNILTKKNGLALVAVMVLLMILTLLVPAMLTYADTATSIAVKGTDKQKAYYFDMIKQGKLAAFALTEPNAGSDAGGLWWWRRW